MVKFFSKLDMTNAYNQIVLSPESRSLTTINTHRGLFQYNRLCFGIASAPGIFQRAVEDLLRGIPGVCVFLWTTFWCLVQMCVNMKSVYAKF